jgi:hypothetical protein
VELVLVRLCMLSNIPATRVRITYLEVSKLGELLPTIIQSAGEGLDLLVNNLVCTNIATLCKCFAANIAAVRALSSMAPLMRLETKSASV